MTQAARNTGETLTGHDFVDAASGIEGCQVIRPTNCEINCAHFDAGNHQSEIKPTNNHSLVLVTGIKTDGVLHSNIGGQQETTTIRPGLLTFSPAGAAQEYDFKGQTTNTLLEIDDALFKRVADIAPDLPTSGCFEARVGWVSPSVQAVIEEQFAALSQNALGSRLLSESLALRLAYELIGSFTNTPEKPVVPPLTKEEVLRVIDFIEDHMEENFDLSDVARSLGRDPFGFTRSFKAATGESPHQYVIQRRLMRVKELLRTTDDRLAEITYATGFANQAHMTSTFSKHVGTSPGKWRKTAQQ